MTVATVLSAEPRDSAAVPGRAAVEIRGLTKRYARRRGWGETLRRPLHRELVTVVRSVTCDIAEGEFFGLLGPNGAGKTTLFKLLAGSVTPDDGTAVVAGFDVVREARDVRRMLTPAVGDDRSLYWRLSACENLLLFAALHGLATSDARRRVEDVMQVVGLAGAGNALVGTFSSGMKQRLLIARALLPNPKVLLLDEPTRSLDPVSAREFRRFLREELCQRRGCTILLATHNADEALELCGRVAVLHQGSLLAVGPAEELARDAGGERYRVWTRHPDHPAWETLRERRVIRHAVVEGEEEGWTRVQLELDGGCDRSSQVIDLLTCAGATVARFERVGLSLADLIERVVARGRDDACLA